MEIKLTINVPFLVNIMFLFRTQQFSFFLEVFECNLWNKPGHKLRKKNCNFKKTDYVINI